MFCVANCRSCRNRNKWWEGERSALQVLGSLSDGLQNLDSFYNCEQTLKGSGQINYLCLRGSELYKD